MFKSKPIEVERVVPLALEPTRRIADRLIYGVRDLLDRARVVAAPTPWEKAEDGAEFTRMDAGRALKARLEIAPVDDGTRIRLRVSGAILMLGRKGILEGILEKLDEVVRKGGG